MIRLALIVLLTCCSRVAVAQQQEGAHGELALRLRDLVVPITAHWADGRTETGFGILVGRQGEEAIVATAGHVLAGGGPDEQATRVEIRLRQRPGRSYVGERLVLPVKRLDLGVAAVPIPADVDWPRAVVAADPERVPRGTPVWLIGQDATWDVPTAPATVNRVSFLDREIVFDGLDVVEGTSGAPLLSSAGLLGLVVREQSNRNGGLAIFITDIEAAFREWNLPWELTGLGETPAPAPAPAPARASTQPQPGQTFTDTLKDGSPCLFCPRLVVIPAGSFTMGSTPEEGKWVVEQSGTEEWTKDEQPAHPVRIATDFALGRTEVTRGQFARFVDATKRDMSGGCYSQTGSDWKLDAAKGWRNPGFDQDDTHPVVCVSWDDAVAYVAWLQKETGKDYRLPSEAQWEYAARAGSTTMRYWGDDLKNRDACTYANAADLALKDKFPDWPTLNCIDGSVYTASVGKLQDNAFHLFDALGNVGEWNEDCYHDSYNGAPLAGILRMAAF